LVSVDYFVRRRRAAVARWQDVGSLRPPGRDACLAFTGGLVCVLAALFAGINVWLLYFFMFFYGGTTFPLYSLCLAHANDNTPLSLIETGSVVLLVHSAGAILGPLALSPLMAIDAYAFFVFSCAILFVFVLWAAWRIASHKAERKYFESFPAVPKTTHEVMEVHEHVEDSTGDAESINTRSDSDPKD